MLRTELAKQLNGREYGKEITRNEEAQAKAAGLVVVFGASDDLMEFRGAIHDEIGCCDGGTAYLNAAGLLSNDCDNANCPHFAKMEDGATKLRAIWDTEGYSWIYETEIPHSTFDILEDGDKYCRGIVFYLSDLKEAK